MHDCRDLIIIFAKLFRQDYKTVLIMGGEEPLYKPANRENDLNQIIFTKDYYSSALHEISHWCLAGPDRRKQLDYGYWYHPDGRNEQQQKQFEKVEYKPQALEWVFSMAANLPFRVSVDNLSHAEASAPSDDFKSTIVQQAQSYSRHGLPYRAGLFAEALRCRYKTAKLKAENFNISALS